MKTIIVTASSQEAFPLLQDLICSLETFPERAAVEIGCMDLDLTTEQRDWLTARGVTLAEPASHLGIPIEKLRPFERAFVARPFLRDYFPGRDVYVWMDADIWLQGWWVIDAYVNGALETGFAITHERERAYVFQGWLYAWFAKHLVLGYGVLDGLWLLSRAHLNSGFFALRSDSPHWKLWEHYYQRAWDRTGVFNPHDQFSINRMVHGGAFARPEVGATLLPPRFNWICDRGPPMWNDAEGVLCEPYPPYRTIGAVHLAGPGKTNTYEIRRTGKGTFSGKLRYGIRPPLAPVGA